MKKIASLILSLTLMLSMFCLCVHGENLKDGTYEVNVTLMHKQDEKESFGNKYVAQKALLKVSSGEKTIVLPLTTDMKSISFSYYLDGSLEGDVAECTPVSEITVGAETYEQGFEIPVMKDGDIGLKFSVPVMPMSPSARLRIDYASAKLISADESERDESGTTTTNKATEETTVATTQADLTGTKETTTAPTQTTVQSTAPTTSQAAQNTNSEKSEETAHASMTDIAMMILFVCAACTLAILTVHKKEDDKA